MSMGWNQQGIKRSIGLASIFGFALACSWTDPAAAKYDPLQLERSVVRIIVGLSANSGKCC